MTPPRVPRALAAALALCLLAAGLLPAGQTARPVKVTVRDEQPRVELNDTAIDYTQRIFPQFNQPLMRFGFQVQTPQGNQNLTCGTDGSTNNTVVRVDGQEVQFGLPQGQWVVQSAPLEAAQGGRKRVGTRSVWKFGGVEFTQIVEVVPSKQPVKADAGPAKRRCDTCAIRYVIENKDARPHVAGIRNMIDTLVAGNDAAGFALPGEKEVIHGADFRTLKEIPPYVMVLQNHDLKNPGLVAYVTPRLGGRQEPPNRLVLTRWPGSGSGWEVPVRDRNAAGDSGYAIYWDPKEIKPGGKREVGFAYGAGLATSPEDEGRMDLALGGSFEPHKTFTVTAYVENPLEGQHLTLDLTPGAARVEGSPVVPVAQPVTGGISVVTWRAAVLRPGEFTLRVRSSTGVTLTKHVTVASGQ